MKLKFHWDRKGKSDENSSCWVRVAQQWAGSGFGTLFIPRIDQEVVVDFLEGDPDRPLVTGRVYNAYQRPPNELPTHATRSGIKTRSTKEASPDAGNEIRFEDKKGEEELFVHAQKDLKHVVENDAHVEIHHDHHAKVDGAQTVKVAGDAGATLDVTADYTVTSDKAIVVSAATSIILKCGPAAQASTIEVTPMSITLSVGTSVIKLDKTGISIAGVQLRLNQ